MAVSVKLMAILTSSERQDTITGRRSMGRRHFLEIEDQSWCPAAVRDGLTDLLRLSLEIGNHYAPAVPRIAAALKQLGQRRVIDFCSGAGGPWLRLLPQFDEGIDMDVCLTDKYPNLEAFRRIRKASNGRIAYCEKSVDATAAPEDLVGFRTLFTSFHHFPPEQARAILRDAVANRQGIGIFEFTHRSPLAVFLCCLSPLGVLLFAPFARPFRWSRLFYTFLIPLLPLVSLFDGVVSCFRTYSPAELTALTAEFGDQYAWEIGEDKSGPIPLPMTYLIGLPRHPGQE
jgi:hypothetical protein